MEQITNLIATTGFPIAMCLIVCWYVYIKDKGHKEEIDKLSDAVNKQTMNIQKLIDKIEQMIGGNNDA